MVERKSQTPRRQRKKPYYGSGVTKPCNPDSKKNDDDWCDYNKYNRGPRWHPMPKGGLKPCNPMTRPDDHPVNGPPICVDGRWLPGIPQKVPEGGCRVDQKAKKIEKYGEPIHCGPFGRWRKGPGVPCNEKTRNSWSKRGPAKWCQRGTPRGPDGKLNNKYGFWHWKDSKDSTGPNKNRLPDTDEREEEVPSTETTPTPRETGVDEFKEFNEFKEFDFDYSIFDNDQLRETFFRDSRVLELLEQMKQEQNATGSSAAPTPSKPAPVNKTPGVLDTVYGFFGGKEENIDIANMRMTHTQDVGQLGRIGDLGEMERWKRKGFTNLWIRKGFLDAYYPDYAKANEVVANELERVRKKLNANAGLDSGDINVFEEGKTYIFQGGLDSIQFTKDGLKVWEKQ